MSITLNLEFEIEYCCTCGVPFAITISLLRVLKQTHRLFYCPNGHSQSYTAQTEAELLRRELAEKQRELEQTQREKKRIEGRVSRGVCPCCNRTFQDLQRHIASKHKGSLELRPPQQAATKRLQ